MLRRCSLLSTIVVLLVFHSACPNKSPAEPAADSSTTPSTGACVNSDAWAATDALGRKLPTFTEAGPCKDGKFVAMFYWTWHVDFHVDGEPVNVETITRRYPEAINDYAHPIWQRAGTGYHWDEPLFGYYRSTDPWVLRKHAEMLADAGVDVIVFDATNGSITWKNSYEVLLPVFEQARQDGVNPPKIAFMLPFGPTPDSLQSLTQLYEDVYKPGRFKELWFMWKGKPLVMAYPDNIPEPMKSFFTFRPGQPVYKTGPTRADHWGWLEIFPQHGFVKLPSGGFEQATVGVAQNATDSLWPAAMNDKDEVYGRGYTVKRGPNHSPDAIARGLNFQEQWERARELNPELVFVTGWNEWMAGRHQLWQNTENAFPDQFNDEYSRDIEPMRGDFGDNYYYQLIANVRRFKGVAAPQPPSPPASIVVDGLFADWKNVLPGYRDHRGDTMHRNHPGYGKRTLYVNTSGRNDIVSAKVARDDENVYFLVETAAPITPGEKPQGMMLLVDVDRDKSTGWQGYDYAINRLSPMKTEQNETALVELNDEDWKWTAVGQVALKVNGNRLEMAVPRRLLEMEGKPLDFEFKWVDNPRNEGDVMDFYQYGDAAPGGRFNYVFQQ